MRLINADGSHVGVSGNGVRCSGWHRVRIAATRHGGAGHVIDRRPTPGRKPLTLLERRDPRFTFRAAMGQPSRTARR